jgi:acyl-coenzyme A synthetase/AMP-(fatty) acid ligase
MVACRVWGPRPKIDLPNVKRMHPADMVFFWAKADPERIALVQFGMAVSYRALAESTEAISRQLDRVSLPKGTTVGVLIDDPPKRLAVCLALLRRGVSAAPVSERTVQHLIASDIHTLICGDPNLTLVGGRTIRFEDAWLRSRSDAPLGAHPARASLAMEADLVFFTSGTTGVPKRIVTTAAALMERVAMLPITGEGLTGRILIVAGLDSAFGLTRTLVRLYAGMTVCFATSYEEQLAVANLFNVESIVASPQQVLGLVEFMEKGNKSRLRSLKDLRIGGGFASADLVARVQSRLCRNVVTEYGSTETGLIAFANYETIIDVPFAVGRPVPGARIEIVDQADRPLPAGEEGLVRCRTNYLLKSLAANNPERSADAENLWWYPGDLGHLTEDGVLCIGGRADDVINCGGAKVSAVKLDEIVLKHPGVKDAGVCSVRGRSGIEEIWIGVVTESEIDVSALTRSLDESQGFRVGVGEVLTIDQVPRNDLGKLQRHKLKEVLLGLKQRAT